MDLLRQLMEMSREPAQDFTKLTTVSNKYSLSTTTRDHVEEGVDEIVDTGPDYIPMNKPGKTKSRTGKKRQPTTDSAQNALVNNLWFMNNSDAN